MAEVFSFNKAESLRIKLTKKQQKQISDIYSQAAKEVGKAAKKAPRVPSDIYRQQYLKDLEEQLNERFNSIQYELNGIIKDNMKAMSEAIVEENNRILRHLGLDIKGAYFFVPDDIVKMVSSGKLYSGDWSLSKAIWGADKKVHQDIRTVIAQGIAQNKSAYDIAKDLEKYVNPKARKEWDWSKVYPGTNKKVDYNAQRLARTMVSHAYQQSFVRVTLNNPFVEEYEWHSSNSGRACELCLSRDGQHYSKTNLPLDHPNGMCTFTAITPSYIDIADRLADWVNGTPDSAIDLFIKDLHGEL